MKAQPSKKGPKWWLWPAGILAVAAGLYFSFYQAINKNSKPEPGPANITQAGSGSAVLPASQPEQEADLNDMSTSSESSVQPLIDRNPGPLLFIGMDGLDLELMAPLFEAGELPHFKKVFESGAIVSFSCDALSEVPEFVNEQRAFWVALLSGKNPARYQLWDYGISAQGSATPGFSHAGLMPWLLSEQGTRVTVIGLPETYPAPEINGIIVSDLAVNAALMLPDQRQRFKYDYSQLAELPGTWPPEFSEELPALLLGPDRTPDTAYQMVIDLPENKWEGFMKIDSVNPRNALSMIKYAIVTDYNTRRAGLRMIEREKTGAAFLYFPGLQIIRSEVYARNRRFKPGFSELNRNYYRFWDGILGDLMKAARPGTLALCSRQLALPQRGKKTRQNEPENSSCGFCVISGPGVKPGARSSGLHASILDIAPSLLYIQCLAIKDEFDGNSLKDIINKEQ